MTVEAEGNALIPPRAACCIEPRGQFSQMDAAHRALTRCSRSSTSAFQRSWSDRPIRSRTLILTRDCSINRYYDPSTDQFLSVDPMVNLTGQPYAFVNDNPLNVTDPLGLKGWYCIGGQSHYFIGNKYRAATGRCGTAAKRNPVASPPKATKSGSTIGNVFQSVSNATANAGLVLDVTGSGAASTGVGLEPGQDFWGAGLVANSISTGTGCVAGAFNDQTLGEAAAGCGRDIAIQYVTESNASGSLLREIGKWYGDVRTAIWDLHNLPN